MLKVISAVQLVGETPTAPVPSASAGSSDAPRSAPAEASQPVSVSEPPAATDSAPQDGEGVVSDMESESQRGLGGSESSPDNAEADPFADVPFAEPLMDQSNRNEGDEGDEGNEGNEGATTLLSFAVSAACTQTGGWAAGLREPDAGPADV